MMPKINALLELLQNSGIPYPIIGLIFILSSILIGRYTPSLTAFLVNRFLPEKGKRLAEDLIFPIQRAFQVAGTLILISLSLVWLERDLRELKEFIEPFLNLAITISIAWLISRIFRQIVRIYGINIIRRSGLEVDELLLVFETIANVIIGIIAALSYAQTQNIKLGGLLAGLGLGGLAISFAASKTLEQLLGTIVLYLDRPFIPGEYVRLPDGLYGRVESIGLRSTKIRAAGKSTLFIIPNNTLANLPIENVTRGKKVMVLLYLDFFNKLEEKEEALVQQVIKESTDSLFGIDPGSTSITLIHRGETTRARITFFILGSSENSIQLRKRLLELANEAVSQKLKEFGIEFKLQEPNIYVESPVTL